MGMDVYGEDPKLVSRRPTIDFATATEEEKSRYFDEVDQFEVDNPGYYFRNNVWWWRPLWMYVAEVANNVLTAKDIESGHANSGHLISKTKAERIARILKRELENGNVQKHATEYMQMLKNLPLVECTHCDGTGIRNDEHVQGTCNACGGTGKVKNFNCNYPFHPENVEDFQRFCQYSGGFRIC